LQDLKFRSTFGHLEKDLKYCISMNVRGMRLVAGLCCLLPAAARQANQPTPQPRQQLNQENEDSAAVGRGRAQFKSSCGFCHGNDATGSRAPDLIRSALLSHDDHGNLVGPVIRNGRPEKGMPSFSTLKDDQIGDIVSFLHHQAKSASASAKVPGDYPVAKLLTGDAEAGKAFFNAAGGCSKCHSVTGDLKGIARKYSPIDLQQQMVYPSDEKHPAPESAVVTLRDGTQYEGMIVHRDEFLIGLTCKDGWYRSWPREDVTLEIRDPLEAHRELMNKYTDADIHNLFAYLETLK
jgi:cytochrome c oxidase cbb3-type subunit 3